RWSGDGEVKAKLNVPTWDAKSWLRDLGVELPDMSDPDALSAVAMQMNVSGSLQQLAVSPLVIDLDDSRIDGSASVDLRQEVPAIEFSASINEVNLDRYMAAADDDCIICLPVAGHAPCLRFMEARMAAAVLAPARAGSSEPGCVLCEQR
uniref:hypothetical protein n=1 Tax=uncultured Parvibaculum sp. TaxID=291828 RepID=UPI0030DAF4CC